MKEDFKNFVNNNKQLIRYVNSDKMTWQKFYDMYSLYGENSDVWDEYLKRDNTKSNISFKLINVFYFIFNFTILYWFCHIST